MVDLEILTRLNPKVSQMDAVGISTAGGLTAADVAAACANCSPLGYLALKRRFIGDMSLCDGYYILYARVIKLAQKNNWEVRPKRLRVPKFKAVLDLCLREYFEISRCRSCKGSGKTATDKEGIILRTCRSCDGTGNKSMNDAMRAKLMGVSRSCYSRSWVSRHKQVMNLFDQTIPIEEDKAIQSVSRLLGSD